MRRLMENPAAPAFHPGFPPCESSSIAAAVFVAAAPSLAHAHGFITTGHRQYDQYGFAKRHGPRAAPWFLYWPYETYFNTPAPTGAPFPPSHMSPGNFQYPNHAQPQQFAPYPTNGYGQPQ